MAASVQYDDKRVLLVRRGKCCVTVTSNIYDEGSAGDGYESFTVFTSGAISGPAPVPPARTEYILSATDFLQLSVGLWFDDTCRVGW